AARNAAELNGALGDLVDGFASGVGDLVEELVQRDELRALHVPVRLFRLVLEVDGARELRVQELDELSARFLGEVVLRLVEGLHGDAFRAMSGVPRERIAASERAL